MGVAAGLCTGGLLKTMIVRKRQSLPNEDAIRRAKVTRKKAD
jgi:hypothetical protein